MSCFGNDEGIPETLVLFVSENCSSFPKQHNRGDQTE